MINSGCPATLTPAEGRKDSTATYPLQPPNTLPGVQKQVRGTQPRPVRIAQTGAFVQLQTLKEPGLCLEMLQGLTCGRTHCVGYNSVAPAAVSKPSVTCFLCGKRKVFPIVRAMQRDRNGDHRAVGTVKCTHTPNQRVRPSTIHACVCVHMTHFCLLFL